jgi:hypothetical protein
MLLYYSEHFALYSITGGIDFYKIESDQIIEISRLFKFLFTNNITNINLNLCSIDTFSNHSHEKSTIDYSEVKMYRV